MKITAGSRQSLANLKELCYHGDMIKLTLKKLTCLLLCLPMMLALLCPVRAEASPPLEVYFLALGRVDAILIRCGDATAFIDVGFESDAKQAIRWLNAMGITHLDSYIGTHGHYDHIEGAPEIIEAFHPDQIYLSHVGCLSAILECATEDQQAIISTVDRTILVPGDQFQIGPATMTCLGPDFITRCYTGDNDENDNSLILRLEYNSRRILFTGDTTDAVLRRLDKQSPGCLRADVLQNPHHNGAHDPDVIDMIAPRYVVFSTDNYNQPKQSYTDLLDQRGITRLCLDTANQGHVGIVIEGSKLEIRCGAAVDAVRLEEASDMIPGQEMDLIASVEPEGALAPDRQLGWNSSNESVAVVDKGRVRAVGMGTAEISAVALNGARATVPVRVTDACVVLEQNAMSLAVNETKRLRGKARGSVEGLEGQWVSEDESVATVSGGKVTGMSEGQTRIIARLSNGTQAFCQVTVKGYLAKSVRLDPRKATMKAGDVLALSAEVAPAGFDMDELYWESSDDSVLWVDAYGNVTAVRKGKATITVTASEGVTDKCSIKVN